MLQKLNERIQGVFAWIMISLISLTFAMFGIEYYFNARGSRQNAATVNGEPITKQAFDLALKRTQQYNDPAALQDGGVRLKQEIMDGMVTRSLSLQSAQNNGFLITPAQIDNVILGIPEFQQSGHFSVEKYQQALHSNAFSSEEFQAEVHQGMVLNQQRFSFIGTSFALPREVKRFVNLYLQTRDYEYTVIKQQSFIKNAKVTGKAIAAYYTQHKREFMTPESVSVEYIQLSMQAIKDKIKPSEEQMKHFYDENKNSFNTPARWHVAHILLAVPEKASDTEKKRIKDKADALSATLKKTPGVFTDFVKKESDDKLSAMKQGELPWITAGQSHFDKALVQLTKVGEISKPVKTANGYQIFKLLDYQPAKRKLFHEVKSDIKRQLITDEAQANYLQAIDQLSELSYQTPDSLEPVAKAMRLKIEQETPFIKQVGTQGITKYKPVINAAFSHDVLEMGNNSELLQLNSDSVAVLRINKHFPAKQQPLNAVKTIIEKRLVEQQIQADAKALGQKMLALKPISKQIKETMRMHGLEWHDVYNATRDSNKVDTTINQIAFTEAHLNGFVGHTLESGDYVVIRLKNIHPGKESNLDKEQRANIVRQLETNYGTMDYELYIGHLLQNAEVVRY